MRSAQAFLVVLGFAVMAWLPVVQASHNTMYTNYPTEHDGLGSSDEPDFLGTTGVLGQSLGERAIDLNLDGVGEPTSSIPNAARRLAPGCTDDAGRQPSGLCGLWTIGALNGAEGTNSQNGVPARTLGVQGSGGPGAPGLTLTKAAQVRFLDSYVNAYYSLPLTGVTYIEYNHKLRDLGVDALLSGLDPSLGAPFVAAQIGHWAWYGKWQDKNGNGVIDHLQAAIIQTTQPPTPVEDPFNEFRWYGNCISFDGAYIPGWHCVDEFPPPDLKRVTILTWVHPGSHHGDCGIFLLGANEALCDMPIDYPGKQAVCFAAIASGNDPYQTVAPGSCGQDLRTMDEFDERTGADPLLGPQDSLVPDVTQDDRTGDPAWDTRAWTGALGLVTWYYDQSLLTTTTMVTGSNCADDTSRRGKDLTTCNFLDIDRFPAWSPALEALLQGLKTDGRSRWTFTRDAWVPFQTTLDGVRNNRLLYDQGLGAMGLGPTQGALSFALVDPGLSREPNSALDAYPGAVRGAFGAPDFAGSTTSFAGYRAAEHAWVDNQMIRAITYSHAIGVSAPGLSTCQFCFAGPGLITTASPEPASGHVLDRDHRRSLGPGQYYFAGFMGRWQDKSQTWNEDVFDLATLSPVQNVYLRGPDGWVGNIVNSTATFYYKGYTDESCTQQGSTGVVPYAWCHPYLDGNLADPQQDGATTHGEWRGKCSDAGAALDSAIALVPAGGTWTVPVIVLENSDFIDLPGYVQRGSIRDYTGTSQPIYVGIHCFDLEVTGAYLGTDVVVFPAGNLGLPVTAVMNVQVPLGGGFETVVDADEFAAWGP